ncbi:hypothetical protein [Gordonia rhizosphera]|uniref:Uncharacterized protein n=1 Tax=Gordonia rhizosphera NBRC 16068 TaxID=1108045 RepID=K6UZG0_9ACTN|nr:hypothetical protein [Gordonia rhizosphera]GAB88878.1 hypothetical protein GORHZ_046_00280 [Gordonia rhizosphera NBRC 16068]
MTSLICALVGVAMLALCGVALRLWPKVGPIAPVVAGMLLALAYDAIIVAVGRFVGFGDVLRALNVPRLWIAAIVPPLLVLVAGYLVRRLGVEQASGRNITLGGYALVAMLILIGVVGASRAELVPEKTGDALRYVDDAASGPPVPAVITVLALIVLGMAAFRYAGFPWLFLGAIIMLITGAAAFAVLWIGFLGQLVLMMSVVAAMAAVAGYRVPVVTALRDMGSRGGSR